MASQFGNVDCPIYLGGAALKDGAAAVLVRAAGLYGEEDEKDEECVFAALRRIGEAMQTSISRTNCTPAFLCT
jgi:hypothetical protein